MQIPFWQIHKWMMNHPKTQKVLWFGPIAPIMWYDIAHHTSHFEALILVMPIILMIIQKLGWKQHWAERDAKWNEQMRRFAKNR